MAPTGLIKDLKRKRGDDEAEEGPKTTPYRQRVLVISSRGITQRHRHLMNDLSGLLPHSKRGTPAPFYSPTAILGLTRAACRRQARLEAPAAAPERALRPRQLQQRPLLRGAQEVRRPLPLGRQGSQRPLDPLPRPQRPHHGGDEDDRKLLEGQQAHRRLRQGVRRCPPPQGYQGGPHACTSNPGVTRCAELER